MQLEKKFFGNPQDGALNADDAPFSLGQNQWVNAENIRVGSTDAGFINTVESIGSTTLLSTPEPSSTFITIGSADDVENGLFCYFRYNVHGPWHRIDCYIKSQQRIYTVLLSSQVEGGLNFSKNFPIFSARIVNGYLYWTEGTNNQPRKINIFSGIKLNDPTFNTTQPSYPSILSPFEITIIKPPPAFAPNIQKATDGTFSNNFIANESFEFAFQYVFYDNEVTVVGTYSPSSRLNTASETSNYISVTMDSLQEIPPTVRIVNLIARISNTNNAYIIKTWDKEISSESVEIDDQNNDITPLTFNFYNNITGEGIAESRVLKPFDSVPIYSGTLEAARNRIFLGNNISGYNTPGITSLSYSLQTINPNEAFSVIKNVIQFRARIGVPGPDNDYSYGGWFVYITSTEYGGTSGYFYINGTEKTAVEPLPPFGLPFTVYPVLDTPPTTTSLGGLTFAGETQSDVFNDFIVTGSNSLEGSAVYPSSYTISITGLSTSVNSVFKSRSGYQIGVVFYDFAMRKCGVVTTDGLIFEIPSRDYAYTSAVNSITWQLSNTNALNEIPEWAYYYAIVRTLNLKTRSFIQSFDNSLKYASKDSSGAYEFTNVVYTNASVGIGINTTALVQSGLGYSFNQGDVCVLIDDADNIYELPVIGQDGAYIIVKAQDIGDLTSKKAVYEIYTPYQKSTQEPFFEIGQMYQILDPGTSSRRYDVLSDILLPDVYAITRNFNTETYFAEAMSPNDLFYSRWDNDGGKPNFITKLGQAQKINYISWSNTFIPNTSINGLSTFDPLDEKDVPQDCGSIQNLQLTSKVQSEGTVMLAICTVETCSVYLGETQILDTTGVTQFFASSSPVIGTINILKGSYGCIDPTSVVEYRGMVFWLDRGNGRIIQYSVNGLFPISSYKMSRFWRLFSLQFSSMTTEQIEALGGRPFVFSEVDPYHNELLLSIPKLLNDPPKGYLPDYSVINDLSLSCLNIRMGYNEIDSPEPIIPISYYGVYVYLEGIGKDGYYLIPGTENITPINTPPPPNIIPPSNIFYSELIFKGSTLSDLYENILPSECYLIDTSVSSNGNNITISNVNIYSEYPFDIWDGKGKTIVFKIGDGNVPPKWLGSYSFNPEWFVVLQNDLFSFKNGQLYQHNSLTSFNNFYGVQYTSKIMFVSNANPSLPKIYNSVSSESNIIPNYVYFYNEIPYIQCSDLVNFEFRNLEGIWYATVKRNKLIPTSTGYSTTGLLTGDKMRAAALYIMVEFSVSTTQLELKFFNIGFTESRGHKV